jgi:hypothetical protein
MDFFQEEGIDVGQVTPSMSYEEYDFFYFLLFYFTCFLLTISGLRVLGFPRNFKCFIYLL